MSRKPSRMRGTASSEMIRKALKNFLKMPKEQRIDLMVKAGSLTPEQAERAKQKWAEIQSAQASSVIVDA